MRNFWLIEDGCGMWLWFRNFMFLTLGLGLLLVLVIRGVVDVGSALE